MEPLSSPMNLPSPLSRATALVWFLSSLAAAQAQGTRADYQRANSFRSLTENKVFKAQVKPHWFSNNTRFWYRNDLAGGAREFVLVDAGKGMRRLAFDHERLAVALAKAMGKDLKPDHLPIEQLDFTDNEKALLLRADGKLWKCDLQNYGLHEQEGETGATAKPSSEKVRRSASQRDQSPDGNRQAFFKDHNLQVRDLETGEEFSLSTDGSAEDEYS